MDVKNVKEMAVFVARSVTAGDRISADGKLSVEDASHVMAPVMAAPEAFKDLGLIPAELKDMDSTEAAEIKTVIAAELDLADDKKELLVEEVLGLTLQMAATVMSYQKARSAGATAG